MEMAGWLRRCGYGQGKRTDRRNIETVMKKNKILILLVAVIILLIVIIAFSRNKKQEYTDAM